MDQDSCVGSMGLHQNNLVTHNEDGGISSLQSQLHSTTGPIFPWRMSSRSVIDVFRDIRDRYFGKPVLPKLSERKASLHSCTDTDDEEEFNSLDALPVYCKLMILSFLDTKDVCKMSLVNSQWHGVANDQILWRELMIRDMCRWISMTNKSHPLISSVWDNHRLSRLGYGVDIADLVPVDNCVLNGLSAAKPSYEEHYSKGVNYKALYIHSSYQRVQDDISSSQQNSGFPSLLKSIWQGSESFVEGEIIITGPGIDSPRTSKIFRSLMWGNEFLETKGLLPGNRDGIGSGVQVIFKGKTPFNLIALYSGNNRIRETRVGLERLRISNVVEMIDNDDDTPVMVNDNNDEDSQARFSLHEAVRFYIAERKGNYKLIYAVDATAGQRWEDIACNKLELDAILKGTVPDGIVSAAVANVDAAANGAEESNPVENNSNSIANNKRPLLVLSCVRDDATPRLSALQIIAMLGLPEINDRQWRVQDVVVSSMQGVEKGIDWLLRQS